MKLTDIKETAGARTARKRVGRGIGSGTGKTSSKGMKGQKSRSGVSLLGFEGGQMPLFRRLPKRGFNNPFSLVRAELNVGDLEAAIDRGRVDVKGDITEAVLVEAGVVRNAKDGVKLLGRGELTKKVSLHVSAASKSAIAAVEKAGGTVTLPVVKEKPAGKGKKHEREKAAKAS